MQLIELNHDPDRQMTGEFARQSFEVLRKPSPTKSVQSMNYRLSGAQYSRHFAQGGLIDRQELNERENEPPSG